MKTVLVAYASRMGSTQEIDFGGNLDPSRATGKVARWVTNSDLAGDSRDWDQIRAWADDIADQLTAIPTPTGI